jgi:hypothetical protein
MGTPYETVTARPPRLPQQTSSASPAAKRETPLRGLQKPVVDGDAAGYLLMQDGTDRVGESSSAVESCLGNSPRPVAQFALGRSVFPDEHFDTLPFHHRCRKVKRISTIRYRPVTVPFNGMKVWLSILLCEARPRGHIVLDAIESRRSLREHIIHLRISSKLLKLAVCGEGGVVHHDGRA